MAIAVELLEPKGFGRVRLAHLWEVNSQTLCGLVGSVVTPGATVRTEGWNVDAPLAKTFGHQSVASSRTRAGPCRAPGVHRVASLRKRWLTGTLHDGSWIDQLDCHLNEFTFRLDRRTARSRGLLLDRLLQQAVATDPTPTETHDRGQHRPLPRAVTPATSAAPSRARVTGNLSVPQLAGPSKNPSTGTRR